MRTLIVGDIHGCLKAFKTLLRVADPGPEDRFVTLGDMIDRGPESKGVLELLINMHSKGILTPLRGNHEIMFMDAGKRESSKNWLENAGGRFTLMSFGIEPTKGWRNSIPLSIWRFINEACLDVVELDQHFMVHAGVEAGLPLEDQPPSVLHWAKLEIPPVPHFSGKIMVCGHTVMPDCLPVDFGSVWGLDTGAYQDFGWLSMVELETKTVWQANQRGEMRKGILQHWTKITKSTNF